jgi:hypothetical protein
MNASIAKLQPRQSKGPERQGLENAPVSQKDEKDERAWKWCEWGQFVLVIGTDHWSCCGYIADVGCCPVVVVALI